MKLLAGGKSALRLGAVVVLVCFFAGRAETQDPSLKPTYGQVNLKSGFNPDPFTKVLTGGGPIKTNLGGVNAFVAKAPDFRLIYTKGSLPLTISAESKGDTTLLINLPNGQWVANDDGGKGLNPQLKFNTPQTGQYDIWVGTYKQGALPQATLRITELGGNKPPNPPAGGGPDPGLKPTYGQVSLKAGFANDPFSKQLTGGGPIKTKLGGVNAFVAKAPDFRLIYSKGNFPLTIYAESKGDTTLLVNLPNGQWIANDDGGAGLNPQIKLPKPQSGQYDIWVGTFKQGVLPQANLKITELK